ncbi:MAG TPA: right-handed parallel beta-helix repeat-containing protein [Pyrinomonadaceae bacterium]
MKTQSTTLKVLTCAIFILTLSSFAQAQATRTWVSGVGDDVNPCSRTAPCKTFAGAISKTAIAGEIDALDGGGFGTVTITKSITIDGAGGFGSVLASGTNGVNINIAANANDPQRRVTLRRLSINGTGSTAGVGTSTGLKGVNVNTNGAAKINIENCYIQNFTTAGIDLAMNEGATGARVSIRDTNITNTGTVGLQANNANAAGFVSVTADNVRIENCTSGVIVKDRSFVTMKDSLVHACTTVGVSIQAPSNNAGLNLERTVVFSTGTGVQRGGAGTVVDLANSSILNNSVAISTGAGTVNTHQNNTIANNTPGGGGTTPVGQQ